MTLSHGIDFFFFVSLEFLTKDFVLSTIESRTQTMDRHYRVPPLRQRLRLSYGAQERRAKTFINQLSVEVMVISEFFLLSLRRLFILHNLNVNFINYLSVSDRDRGTRFIDRYCYSRCDANYAMAATVDDYMQTSGVCSSVEERNFVTQFISRTNTKLPKKTNEMTNGEKRRNKIRKLQNRKS